MRKILSSPELLFSCLIAIAAAAAVAAVGMARGTFAAGGSDSSCYALMADAFAAGALQPVSELAARVPWPHAANTFAPGGFVPSEHNPSAPAPVCAPGFSVLLAPLIAVGGRDAMFLLTPAAGALLVWMTFLAGQTIAGPLAGAMAAVLIAASPAVLYQVVQPMNDVMTAALWMATFVALLRRRWALAGMACGAALLVRPNLLPLALVAMLAIPRTKNVALFAVAAAPFGLVVPLLNNALYGSPFRTGYGQLGQMFGAAAVPVNAANYLKWLVETHTPFLFLGLAAPFVGAREKRRDALLAIGLTVATFCIYLFYTPFDDWTYVRFLLPAIALMVVLASAFVANALGKMGSRMVRLKADTTDTGTEAPLVRLKADTTDTGAEAPLVRLKADTTEASASRVSVVSGFSRTVIAAAITTGVAVYGVRTAADRLAFDLQFLEQRYRSAGIVVRDRLPPNAVVLSVWDSGAVRFHGRKEAISWAAMDPLWLDRSVSWLEAQGHPPYILVESWEEQPFRNRFGNHSDIGKLDWPPKYEIDRVVRIFDPKDRSRYHRGESVITEDLWPLRR